MPNNVKSCKKIDEKAQTAKFTVLQGEISSAVLKTWKTRKTKTWITQFFQIVCALQGTTIWKMRSWGFRKCGTFWVYDFLKGSYWRSKLKQILRKNIARGTTDPGIASITWIISPATKQANSLERKIQVKHSIGSNFGQMTLPALVLNLPTRWRHLKIQIEHSIGSNFGH